MLDLKFIKANPEAIKEAIEKKNLSLNLDDLLAAESELHKLKQEEQELQTERNKTSKLIPKASNEERPELIKKGKEIGAKLDELKPHVQSATEKLNSFLLKVPQIPSPEAPVGKDDSGNIVIRKEGEVREFSFKPLDHVDILEKNDWAEFKNIAEVCGSRSYSLKNEMLLLEFALHRFALEKLAEKGFTLIGTPSFARDHAFIGTGHFPDSRDQVYHLEEDNIYLSGTAEVQLNSLNSRQILNESDLPILYAGYSPCFRREAGSYGRDVRGLIRVHQFMKVEQYVICSNSEEESKKWHQNLLETSEEIMRDLELPYQVLDVCTGDMGTGKVRQYDIEAWVPSEGKYRETHSCSTLFDWQARRTNTRYRDKEGNVQHCHTLNNTAIATPRILVPFIENHQTEDGNIRLPEKFRSFMGGKELLK